MPVGIPRSLVIAPAVLVPCAAIYFSFASEFSEWFFLPLMWLVHLALFAGLVMGAFGLRHTCLRIGLNATAAMGLCITAQVLTFIAAVVLR